MYTETDQRNAMAMERPLCGVEPYRDCRNSARRARAPHSKRIRAVQEHVAAGKPLVVRVMYREA